LYGGCLIKSTQAHDLGYIAEADLSQYSKSIQNILKKFGQPAYVIPGHESWKSPKSIEHTLKLIKKQNR
jgi:metallo-beta-lactamase class B